MEVDQEEAYKPVSLSLDHECRIPIYINCYNSCVVIDNDHIGIIGGLYDKSIYSFNLKSLNWSKIGEYPEEHPLLNGHSVCKLRQLSPESILLFSFSNKHITLISIDKGEKEEDEEEKFEIVFIKTYTKEEKEITDACFAQCLSVFDGNHVIVCGGHLDYRQLTIYYVSDDMKTVERVFYDENMFREDLTHPKQCIIDAPKEKHHQMVLCVSDCTIVEFRVNRMIGDQFFEISGINYILSRGFDGLNRMSVAFGRDMIVMFGGSEYDDQGNENATRRISSIARDEKRNEWIQTDLDDKLPSDRDSMGCVVDNYNRIHMIDGMDDDQDEELDNHSIYSIQSPDPKSKLLFSHTNLTQLVGFDSYLKIMQYMSRTNGFESEIPLDLMYLLYRFY